MAATKPAMMTAVVARARVRFGIDIAAARARVLTMKANTDKAQGISPIMIATTPVSALTRNELAVSLITIPEKNRALSSTTSRGGHSTALAKAHNKDLRG